VILQSSRCAKDVHDAVADKLTRYTPHSSRANSPYPGRVCGGIVRNMTQTPESRAEPTTVSGQSGNDDRNSTPSRLGQVTAWVVIVAGVVFVVAVVFFSGLFLGWSSGAQYGWHRGYYGGRDGTCPMMGPGGP
jgi:hypothetical protein